MSSFDQIANILTSPPSQKTEVTLTEFNDWQNQLALDLLKGDRLGQSFCNFFNISNFTPLFYVTNNEMAMQWIKTNWLKK